MTGGVERGILALEQNGISPECLDAHGIRLAQVQVAGELKAAGGIGTNPDRIGARTVHGDHGNRGIDVASFGGRGFEPQTNVREGLDIAVALGAEASCYEEKQADRKNS